MHLISVLGSLVVILGLTHAHESNYPAPHVYDAGVPPEFVADEALLLDDITALTSQFHKLYEDVNNKTSEGDEVLKSYLDVNYLQWAAIPTILYKPPLQAKEPVKFPEAFKEFKKVDKKLNEVLKYLSPNLDDIINFWDLPVANKLQNMVYHVAYLNYLAAAVGSPDLKDLTGNELELANEAIRLLDIKRLQLSVPNALERVLVSFGSKFPFSVDREIKRILETSKTGPTNQEWVNWLEEHRRTWIKLLKLPREELKPEQYRPWNIPQKFNLQLHGELTRAFQRLLNDACAAQDAIPAPKNKWPREQKDDPRIKALDRWAAGPFPLQVFLKEYDPKYHPRGKDYVISDMLRILFKTQQRQPARYTKGYQKSVDDKYA